MVVSSRKKSGRGHKISKVKRNNQIRTKLIKQGKMKMKRNHRPANITRKAHKQPPRPQVPPEGEEEESDGGEDMMNMVEMEDLDFLKEAVSAKSYSMLKRLRYSTPTSEGPPKRKKAEEGEDAVDKMEEQFEENMDAELRDVPPLRELLPIKTKDGLVRQTTSEMPRKKVAFNIIEAPKENEEEEKDEGSDLELELQLLDEKDETRVDLSKPISTAQMLALRDETLQKYRLLIGTLSSGLLEDTENKLANLKPLLAMLSEPQPAEVRLTVPRLAAVSLLEVFKDILPEYQIKNVDESGVKLKKDTQNLRTFERTQLSGYKQYLAHLEKLLHVLRRKGGTRASPQAERLGCVALDCLAQMLVARPTFNYAFNLVRLLVPFLDHRAPDARASIHSAISAVLKADRKGEISLEIVRRINALIKSKQHAVRPETLTVLLSLRIKDINLDQEKEMELKQKKFVTRKQKILSMSKRERKREKRMAGLTQELLETKAEETKQTKQRFFTEVTKLLFTVFFRVLKSAPSSQLLAATLEGLAKFAHCINVEFYQDLVTVLDQLAAQGGEGGRPLTTRQQLLCVQTVFTILSGHGEFLTIDPSRFYAHLYRNLLPLNAGHSQADLNVALVTLSAMINKRRKSISQQRLLAFTKRLTTLATQQQHHGALGCLQIVKLILQLSRSMDILLEPDASCGQGMFLPELEEPEYCNASNTALWELPLLQRHYHPVVRQYGRHIVQGVPTSGNASLPAALDKLSAEELFKEFDPSQVAFNPPISTPKTDTVQKRLNESTSNFRCSSLKEEADDLLNSSIDSNIDFFTALCSSGKNK